MDNKILDLFKPVGRCMHPSVTRVLISDALGIARRPGSSEEHLKATMRWLCVAHDVCDARGVSAGYSIRHGWLPPYPETTGYIIPTMLAYAGHSGDDQYVERAAKMADWECEIQLPNGGVIGGVYRESGESPAAVVFNTGQVLLGLIEAFRHFQDQKYFDAAVRAGEWLLDVQTSDGAWRLRGVETETDVHAYDVRTAWSLLELEGITQIPKYRDFAERNLKWVLSQEQPNFWYKNNAFFSDDKWGATFTHTIAYVMEGIFGSWKLTNEKAYLDAVVRCAEKLLRNFEVRRYMSGDFNENWASSSRYSCLTGNAQIAGVWINLYNEIDDPRFLNAALKLTDMVKGTQSIAAIHRGVSGGVKGSDPIWGAYTPYVYPNWAAKFFADTLMTETVTMRTLEARLFDKRDSPAR